MADSFYVRKYLALT